MTLSSDSVSLRTRTQELSREKITTILLAAGKPFKPSRSLSPTALMTPMQPPASSPLWGPSLSKALPDKQRPKLRLSGAPSAPPALSTPPQAGLQAVLASTGKGAASGDSTTGYVESKAAPAKGQPLLTDLGDGTSLQPIPATLRQNNKENSPGNRRKGSGSARPALGAVLESEPASTEEEAAPTPAVPRELAALAAADVGASAEPASPPPGCCGALHGKSLTSWSHAPQPTKSPCIKHSRERLSVAIPCSSGGCDSAGLCHLPSPFHPICLA